MSDLQFTPQSDDAIEALKAREEEERLLADGEATFEVVTATAKNSKTTGIPMIAVKMNVWDCNGKTAFIDEYLMAGDKSFFIKKIKSFCESIGIIDKYNSGKLNATDINSSHFGKIIIGRRKDNNGKIQNNVIEYIKKTEGDVNNNAPFLNDSLDDIAF